METTVKNDNDLEELNNYLIRLEEVRPPQLTTLMGEIVYISIAKKIKKAIKKSRDLGYLYPKYF